MIQGVTPLKTKKFVEIITDSAFYDYPRMQRRFPDDFKAALKHHNALFCAALPLRDADGKPVLRSGRCPGTPSRIVRLLCEKHDGGFGLKAAEDEIYSSLKLDGTETERESVRKILRGEAPQDKKEEQIERLAKAIAFISDKSRKMTKENFDALYRLLFPDEKSSGRFYRESSPSERLPVSPYSEPSSISDRMDELCAFAQSDDDADEPQNAAAILFYIMYLCPYPKGNACIARLAALWYLVTRGCCGTLFVPFSALILETEDEYRESLRAVQDNKKAGGTFELMPFIDYMQQNVYRRMTAEVTHETASLIFDDCMQSGGVTPKEQQLWQFVTSHYGAQDFSTKQLEKDCGDAAYATIRAFVMKFESMGLLTCAKMGNRVRYSVRQ